jgi:carbonic anhydrase
MRKLIVVALFLLPLFASAQNVLWPALMDGNAAYVKGDADFPRLPQTRMTWAASQAPPFSILSCSDSRVPAELIFVRTVGELFVARVAGNTPGTFDIASLQYAVANKWTRLIVVMAHSDCGAVKAAMATNDNGLTDQLKALVKQIRDSGIERTDKPTAAQLRTAAIQNAKYAAGLVARSSVIREALAAGNLTIIIAYYDVGSGTVEQIGEITSAE